MKLIINPEPQRRQSKGPWQSMAERGAPPLKQTAAPHAAIESNCWRRESFQGWDRSSHTEPRITPIRRNQRPILRNQPADRTNRRVDSRIGSLKWIDRIGHIEPSESNRTNIKKFKEKTIIWKREREIEREKISNIKSRMECQPFGIANGAIAADEATWWWWRRWAWIYLIM